MSFLHCHGLVTVQLPASSNLILKAACLYLLNILFESPLGIIKCQPATGEVEKPCCSWSLQKGKEIWGKLRMTVVETE